MQPRGSAEGHDGATEPPVLLQRPPGPLGEAGPWEAPCLQAGPRMPQALGSVSDTSFRAGRRRHLGRGRGPGDYGGPCVWPRATRGSSPAPLPHAKATRVRWIFPGRAVVLTQQEPWAGELRCDQGARAWG